MVVQAWWTPVPNILNAMEYASWKCTLRTKSMLQGPLEPRGWVSVFQSERGCKLTHQFSLPFVQLTRQRQPHMKVQVLGAG